MHLDVATGGELHVALAAGVPADRLVLHGNNKSLAELRAARDGGRRPHRRRQLRRARPARGPARRGRPRARRCCCGSPRASRRTPTSSCGPASSTPSSASACRPARPHDAVGRARTRRPSSWSGCTCTSAARCSCADFFQQAVEVVAPFVREPGLPELVDRRRPRRRLRRGRGGADDHRVGRRHRGGVPRRGHHGAGVAPSRAGRSSPRRPSRSTRSARSRTSPASAPTSSVDGGMSDNPRPVLYGSGYETFLPRAPRAPSARGRCRSSASTASPATCWCATAQVPGRPRRSATCSPPRSPGAYGHSMGSNYNKVLRPAVVFVADGEARLVVRRETVDDLLRHDVG